MKKFYKYIAVIAIATAAGFTTYSTQGNKLHLSSLAIENVEALANEEYGMEYHLIPCPSFHGNECTTSQYNYPTCGTPTYCN